MHSAGSEGRRFIAAVMFVAVAVAWTHWPALSATALSFDDDQYLVANRLVRNPSWRHAGRFLSEMLAPSTVEGYYQPLSMISLMLDCARGGGVSTLRPFHVTSLCLHVANSALVALILFRLFGRAVPAAICGLLFGVHPLTVETIPWIGERKTLLCTFFALAAILCHVAYSRHGRRAMYAGTLLAYACSLLAKPTSTPLPLMMLLMDIWPLHRFGRRAILEKLPLLGVGAASAVITYVSQARTSGVILPTQYGPLRIPLSICHNMVFYIQKMLWPVNLSSHYPIPASFTLSDGEQLAYVLAAGVLIVLLILSVRCGRAAVVGYAMFVLGLLPTMQIVGFTTVIASDKYAYLPAIGLLIALCWGLCRLWGFFTERRRTGPRIAIVAVALLAAATEARASRRYLDDWRDTESLCRRMIRLAPKSPTLYTNLGNHLLKVHRIPEAVALHAKAVQLGPNLWLGQHDYGNALYEAGKIDEAMTRYRASLAIHPSYALAHSNLGVALLAKGLVPEAMVELRTAVELEPKLAVGHYNLSRALAERGLANEAVAHLRETIRLNPEHADACSDLGVLLAARQESAEAIRLFREAIRLRPDEPQGHFNLGRALQDQGDMAGAAEAFRRVVQLDPTDEDARSALESCSRRP